MSDKTGAIQILIEKLRKFAPPSISMVVAKLGDIEEYQAFVHLIRDYLPEYEAEILMNETETAKVVSFCTRFQDRYFPLQYSNRQGLYAEGDIDYYDLTRGIPLIARGVSYSEYDQITAYFREGYQLMTYLLEDPYEPDSQRVALAEACNEFVSKGLLERVPATGITLNEARDLFNNTKYAPMLKWFEWVCQDTGNFFLDTDDEMYYSNWPGEDWDKEAVSSLTRQWQQAELTDEEIGNFATWLEEDMEAHFKEILDFIDERR